MVIIFSLCEGIASCSSNVRTRNRCPFAAALMDPTRYILQGPKRLAIFFSTLFFIGLFAYLVVPLRAPGDTSEDLLLTKVNIIDRHSTETNR